MLELTTMGDLQLTIDGRPVPGLRSSKARALLVYLALEREPQPRTALATMLWPESDQKHANTSLRVALSALNKACGAYLIVSRDRLGMDWSQPIRVDFNQLLKAADTPLNPQLLDGYKGPFLEGFSVPDSEAFETWRTWQQERLLQAVTGALHRAIKQALGAGFFDEAIDRSRQLLKIDPLDEAAHCGLMSAYAMQGHRAAAIDQYGRCLEVLRGELGAEPSYQTRLLYERILSGPVLGPRSSTAGRRAFMPQKSPLVGRQEELADLLSRITSENCRLATVLGPGGVGKSRLALEALRKASDHFRDGTFFCPLGSVQSEEFLIPALAQTLNCYIDGLVSVLDPKSQLLDFLSTRRILLALDGFEHLIACSDLVADMLTRAPDLTLLITTRERIQLSEEWVLPLTGLPFERIEALGQPLNPPALELFEQRRVQAGSVSPLGSRERRDAGRICALAEGNPLAIELAAGWSATLQPSEILSEMEHSLDFLTARLRDVPEAHRSLRAVFEHSWSLLSPRLRSTFAALSTFRGSFDRQAAESVAGAGWADLSDLVEKSLLRRSPLGRYSLHALLHEYAAEKLEQDNGTHEQVHAAHARYYLGLLRQAAPDLISTGMPAARAEVARELTNIWLGLEWAVAHFSTEEVHGSLDDLFSFYVVHGWHEGAGAFDRLARIIIETRPGVDVQQRFSELLFRSTVARQGWFLAHLGRGEECQSVSRACLEWANDDPSSENRSLCLNNLGIAAIFEGKYEQAARELKQAIELGQGHAEPVYPSYYLWLGYLRFFQGLYPESMEEYQMCYDLFDRQGNQPGKAFALSKMGLSADGIGSYTQGMEYHRQALEIFRTTNHLSGQAYTCSRMSVDAYGMQDYVSTATWAEDGLKRFSALGHRWGMSMSLCRLAFSQIGSGRLDLARASLLGALGQAHEHNMAPLMLYAVLGLACVIQCEGDMERAAGLRRAVEANPQTPKIYLDLAARWLGEPDHPIREPTRAATPALEASQRQPPSPDLKGLVRRLLDEARVPMIDY